MDHALMALESFVDRLADSEQNLYQSVSFCSEQGELNEYLLSGDSRFRLKQS